MKKLLSIFLATMMMIAMTTTVFAAGDVAEVGGTNYDTIQAAIDAANTGDTVTVLDSFTTTDSISVAGAAAEITLDLNGKTITYDGSDPAIQINDRKLTIIDTIGGGTIEVKASAYNAIAMFYASELVFKGGTLKSETWGIEVYHDGVVTLDGGNIELSGSNPDHNAISLLDDLGGGEVYIKSGTVTANGVGYPLISHSGGPISITGGTFDFTPALEFVDEYYTAVDNGNGTYSVKEMDKNIYVEGVGYFYTLEQAFAAVGENGVITIEAAGEYVWPNTVIPAGVKVVGSVDGVVATSDGTTSINATTLTVENIDFKAYFKAAFVGNNAASSLTFTDCSFTPTAGPEYYAFHVDDSAANAEVTFNNCVFNGLVTLASEVTQINVNGGKINQGFVARQNTKIDGAVLAETAVIQLGTSDQVTGIEVTITEDCSVEDTDGDGVTPELKDFVNPNGNTTDNSVVVGEEAIVGDAKKYDLDFETNPADAKVVVKDADGNEVAADNNGTYPVSNGSRYTYEVSKGGYKTKTGSLVVKAEDTLVEVTLEKEKVETYVPEYVIPNTAVK